MQLIEMTPDSARDHLDALAALLVDVVEAGASVSFMSPFTLAEARLFWTGVLARLERAELFLLAALDDTGLVGTTQLVVGLPPNQAHRADVAKVLVHTRARRRGIARELMALAESVAVREGRWLLVLDTVSDSPAEALYRGLGYDAAGVIPDYARMPDGELTPTTVMFKRLRSAPAGARLEA